MTGRVLVLGGTGEARRLATGLADEGVDVVSSLAGRVADPVLPPGEVRVGGFGGVAGLGGWLQEHPVATVVDATHPFAATMTASAAEAAGLVGVPLLRLQRPGWTPQPGDDWRWVDSLAAAAEAGAGFRHGFLTTGRMGLGGFAGLPHEAPGPASRTGGRMGGGPLAGLPQGVRARPAAPPAPPLQVRTTVILERGPFTV